MIIKFPQNYPQAPPKVCLCTPIEGHPNVFSWGDEYPYVCLDMLKPYTSDIPFQGWSSAYSVTSLLLQLQSFLFEENAVPQDHGGSQQMSVTPRMVTRTRGRAKSFTCKSAACGHCHASPSPALPQAAGVVQHACGGAAGRATCVPFLRPDKSRSDLILSLCVGEEKHGEACGEEKRSGSQEQTAADCGVVISFLEERLSEISGLLSRQLQVAPPTDAQLDRVLVRPAPAPSGHSSIARSILLYVTEGYV